MTHINIIFLCLFTYYRIFECAATSKANIRTVIFVLDYWDFYIASNNFVKSINFQLFKRLISNVWSSTLQATQLYSILNMSSGNACKISSRYIEDLCLSLFVHV